MWGENPMDAAAPLYLKIGHRNIDKNEPSVQMSLRAIFKKERVWPRALKKVPFIEPHRRFFWVDRCVPNKSLLECYLRISGLDLIGL